MSFRETIARRVVATCGALEAASHARLMASLARHVRGDWGCVDPDGALTNDEAAHDGSRILSASPIDPAMPCARLGKNCLWVITEADRSVTTILLPEEY